MLTSPTSISKMRTPRPHQSTARVYDVSVNTSGAKNSGVPQNVLVRSLKPIPEGSTEHVHHSKTNLHVYLQQLMEQVHNSASLKILQHRSEQSTTGLCFQ